MQTNLKIDGMTCQMCVGHVTKALQNVPGVESVKVTLTPGEAEVEHSGADSEALLEAVREEGYEAALKG